MSQKKSVGRGFSLWKRDGTRVPEKRLVTASNTNPPIIRNGSIIPAEAMPSMLFPNDIPRSFTWPKRSLPS